MNTKTDSIYKAFFSFSDFFVYLSVQVNLLSLYKVSYYFRNASMRNLEIK